MMPACSTAITLYFTVFFLVIPVCSTFQKMRQLSTLSYVCLSFKETDIVI